MTMALILLALSANPAVDARPFALTVVDEQTGRGVPLVDLKTVNEVHYVTDSAGVAAVYEPGLMGQSVFFQVKSHGYEFPADGFGIRGKALTLTEGGSATLKIRRINVAERLYRITGEGIYRDSVLVGRSTPIRAPLLNGRVFGSDSVLTAPLGGKLYWFWGDTNRPDYPLGNYHTPGATSDLPGHGLDPNLGINFSYFVNETTGFARPTAELPGKGPTWLTGLASIADEKGRGQQLVAGYAKVRPNMETYEHGLVAFDPSKNVFEKVATFPIDAPLRPTGHTFQPDADDYLYYANPFPIIRVRARLADLKDSSRYEGFSPLKTGTKRINQKLDNLALDLDAEGKVRYAWRPDTAILTPPEEQRLFHDNLARERILDLRDVETDAFIYAHTGSVHWNAHRNRWVMIAVQRGGSSSFLGEVWYAEAETPLGPWAYARKVVTHDRYSFYNPVHHPEFDQDGGRWIYFEGTYTITFSRDHEPTPRYDYNQMMYRLDLNDPRLNLPVPVYALGDGRYATGHAAAVAARGVAPAFFALERPGSGTVAVFATGDGLRSGKPPEGAKVLFHANGELAKPARSTIPLGPIVHDEAVGSVRVWRSPSGVRLPIP